LAARTGGASSRSAEYSSRRHHANTAAVTLHSAADQRRAGWRTTASVTSVDRLCCRSRAAGDALGTPPAAPLHLTVYISKTVSKTHGVTILANINPVTFDFGIMTLIFNRR